MRKSRTGTQTDWVDVDTALSLLTIKRQTLYAYVSRGHIRAMPKPGDHRASLYALPDIQRMARKRRRPRKRADVAKSTIRWGEPILETGISTVIDGRLVFGTKDACAIAQTYTLEEAAYHHWKSEPQPGTVVLPACFTQPTPMARGFAFLAEQAASAAHIYNRDRQALALEAAALLPAFADSLIGKSYHGPIHTRLARAWGLNTDHTDTIRRALVLISDHELNASTFAVRVAASTGAALPACALAGLSALSGPLHGEATERATAYLRAAITAARQGRAIDRFLSENPKIPGMGHPLYPGGDIRAAALLSAINPPDNIAVLIDAFEAFCAKPPDIDMAHAALSVTLGLPKGAGLMIFAIGRMAGWLAHAIEQNGTGDLIRPRAVFRGAAKQMV